MKKDFLELLKAEDFKEVSTDEQIQFKDGRWTLKLEDNDWDNICFDFYVDDTYVTCITTLDKFIKIINLL